MKVYSSDINIDVYGSDQNRANHILKETGASNKVCLLHCFSSRWRHVTVKQCMCLTMSESLNNSLKPVFHNFNIKNWCIKYIIF